VSGGLYQNPELLVQPISAMYELGVEQPTFEQAALEVAG
jgi:hypothetical protein